MAMMFWKLESEEGKIGNKKYSMSNWFVRRYWCEGSVRSRGGIYRSSESNGPLVWAGLFIKIPIGLKKKVTAN